MECSDDIYPHAEEDATMFFFAVALLALQAGADVAAKNEAALAPGRTTTPLLELRRRCAVQQLTCSGMEGGRATEWEHSQAETWSAPPCDSSCSSTQRPQPHSQNLYNASDVLKRFGAFTRVI